MRARCWCSTRWRSSGKSADCFSPEGLIIMLNRSYSLLAKASGDDGDKPYGDVEYADPGYQSDGKKRYPIDTAAHIRAAWNYINQAKNQEPYSADQVSK